MFTIPIAQAGGRKTGRIRRYVSNMPIRSPIQAVDRMDRSRQDRRAGVAEAALTMCLSSAEGSNERHVV